MASFYPVRIDQEIIGVGNVIVDITDLKRAQQTIARNLETVVVAMATTVEHRDPYTAGHQRRVAHLAVAIAAELGLEPRTIEGIKMAASIHDIGKISIPAEILSKPGPLSPAERALIREHAETGFRIVAGIEFPWPVAEMIRQHHERLDGSGYPRGLRQDEIDFGARVLAVADVVEAMTAHRPYRSGLGLSAALRQIREDQGRLLDTEVVGACCHVLRNGWSLSPEGRTALADPEFGSAGWRHG
jgi:putative nucleotidyltransferase with HDIG domain